MSNAHDQKNAALLKAALIIGLITAVKIAALFTSALNLGPDEAQYWSWSRDLAFGYFSKPPMIAWTIALTTGLGGASEAFIRLSSPVLHFAASLAVFALARDIHGPRIAFWTALTYTSLPAISFSSGLITTDVPLLFFWSVALLAFHRVLATKEAKWAVLLGAALGLGLLSKYAMAYFFLCAGILFLVAPDTRWFAASRHALISLGVTAAIIAPNIIWNAAHDLSTLSHTAANANWGGDLFNSGALLEFLAGQFGIMGPLLFIGFLWGVFVFFRNQKNGAKTTDNIFLLSFTLPVLLLVSLQSFISRANANWAASAYIGATIFTVGWLMKRPLKWVIPVSLALHAVVGAGLFALSANLPLVEAAGLSNAFKRVRGWDILGAEIADIAAQGGYGAILTDDRLVMAELLYYARPRTQSIFIWDHDGVPQNHYEMTAAFGPNTKGPVLLAARAALPANLLSAFDYVEKLETLRVRTGVDKERTLTLYRLEGFHGR